MFIYVFSFLLGAVVGSHLNVLIDRLPRKRPCRGKPARFPNLRGWILRNLEGFSSGGVGESVIFGRSRCGNCRTPLLWYDLIPIFSFFWLKGRCRFCGARIPWRLLVVELITGLGFVVIACVSKGSIGSVGSMGSMNSWPLTPLTLLTPLILFSSFIVLFFTDLEYGVLPDRVVIPAVVVALLWRIIEGFGDYHGLTSLILNTKYLILDTRYWLLPALGLSLFFLLLIAITRGRGMGFGDAKLGFLVGLVLGWPGTLVAAFLAFLLGGLVSAILLVTGRKHFGEAVPFGPFLIIGTGIAALFGSEIWSWYMGVL